MTPLEVAQWAGAALAVVFAAVIIGAVVYGVIDTIRKNNRERQTFNTTNTFYSSDRENT